MSDQDRSKKRTETRRLLCTLTPSELQAAGAKLAEVCEDIANEERGQTDIKAQLKAKMTGLEAKRTEIAMIVRRKADYKEVPVETLFNYDTAIVEDVRTDTGEVLMRRAMSDHERQMKLIQDEGDEHPAEPVPA
jgi:hypothetical protein